MNTMLSHQIEQKLEVYIDDMIVKTVEGCNYDEYSDDVLQSIKKYRMRLNPTKCTFKVQAGKFLGFILTK